MTELSALWQTIIGAAASIVGGLLAVWWQTRRSGQIAKSVRREERREEGLFALNAGVVGVVQGVDRAYRSAERDPAAWSTAWTAVRGEVDGLLAMWDADLSGKIPDRSVMDTHVAVRGHHHDCVNRFGAAGDPRVITATPQDFMRDVGRLLMLLGELKKEIGRQVDGLRA